MSIADPIAKAKKTNRALGSDPNVKSVLNTIQGGGASGLAHLEIVLLEGALEDLHKHRDKIRGAGERAVKSKRSKTKKYYRAVAKTRFATGVDVPEIVWISKNRMITIPEYKREDGTVVPEHSRRLPDGHSARDRKERENAIEEFEEAKEYQRDQAERERKRLDDRDQKIMDRNKRTTGGPMDFSGTDVVGGPMDKLYDLEYLDGLAERVFQGENAETYHGAISSFLNESTIGQGIAAVAGFFADTGSKFQFAARAISEFGPWAGTRLAFNYFRYGGYDVPMKEKNGKVVTEMGDKLPVVVSQKESHKALIEVLRKRIPGQSAEDSDAEPPSEGFLIDKDGNILAHGVGRGNDHFLPFNARHLKRMRDEEGVEYIRRRMYGGPTSEDLHAAMLMGADRFTVISNGGEFVVDLTRRSHGLKMEHMQVLARFQQILDNKAEEEGLNFSGYNSALDTLQAEFPLHFKKAFSKEGDWGNREDRIRPENRFIEGLRSIVGSLAGIEFEDDEPVSRSMPTQTSTGERLWEGARHDSNKNMKLDELPWRRANMDRDTWLRRQRDGNRSGVEVVNQVVNAYRKAGLVPPKEFLDQQQKSQGSGSRIDPQRQKEAAARALGGSTRGTSTPDSTSRAAQKAQPTTARFSVPPEAQRIADRIFGGVDLKGYDTSNTEHARDLATTILHATPEQLEDLQNDRNFLDDLTTTFPHITR